MPASLPDCLKVKDRTHDQPVATNDDDDSSIHRADQLPVADKSSDAPEQKAAVKPSRWTINRRWLPHRGTTRLVAEHGRGFCLAVARSWRWRCGCIFLVLLLLVVGLVLQIRDAQRLGRPGYPTKAGMLLLVGGILLAFDVMYREEVGGPLRVQPIAPMVAMIGALVMAGRVVLFWKPGFLPLTLKILKIALKTALKLALKIALLKALDKTSTAPVSTRNVAACRMNVL